MTAEYIAHFYGDCLAERCECRKGVWLGVGCNHWHPCVAKTEKELSEWQFERARR